MFLSVSESEFFLPVDFMKFRLTYDGHLPTSGGNVGGRIKDKWAIRKQIAPQLAELWEKHPALQELTFLLSGEVGYGGTVETVAVDISPSPKPGSRQAQSILVGGKPFIPLVRKSLDLACELNILFLRKEEPGSLILQGGDLDNRIKTLFDALKVPNEADLKVEQPDTEPFYCLLEEDALITSFGVETDRLLAKPDTPVNQVYLVIEVNVRVMRLTVKNVGFLGN